MDLVLRPGDTFERDYRVVTPLSEGGMGALFVVEQVSTGKRRALKLMRSSAGNDENARRRFAQEARVGSLIESEHVVEVIAAGVEEVTNTPWLVMELLEGEDLGAFLDRVGTLSQAATSLVFSQLCHGLAAAHAIPVVHRDLKPENIFLARSRVAQSRFLLKILDFGIAKVLVEGAKTTGNMGTPLWMAPEQAASRSQITPAADVWALGLIAFRMLTGKYFWREANIEDGGGAPLMREILVDEIPRASERATELGAEWPVALDDWFARCTARDAAARYPDASEAWAALEPLLSGSTEGIALELRAPPITRNPSESSGPRSNRNSGEAFEPTLAASGAPVTTRVIRPAQPRRGAIVAASALGILVLAGLGFALTRGGASPSTAASSEPTQAPSAAPAASADPPPQPTQSVPAPLPSATAVTSATTAPSSRPGAKPRPTASATTTATTPATKPTTTGGNPLKMDLQ